MSSPSEKYAAWQESRRRERTELGAFARRVNFELDPFQNSACSALESGRSVLVAAPTGAGKTVVGEFAIHLALARGQKVFYTAPIKALSNQKHAELCEWLGADRVGLLTGDTSVRPDADVVVMTTEVLRNMLYADSALLDGLGYVVMDEVHYLADRLRGPVWEEVILHLPTDVHLVALSATVSNAEEFGAWLQEVRGDTDVIVSEVRPVPLWQHVVIGDQLLDLFVDDTGDAAMSHGPHVRGNRTVNPELERTLSLSVPVPDAPRYGGGRGRHDSPGRRGHGGARGGRGRGAKHRSQQRAGHGSRNGHRADSADRGHTGWERPPRGGEHRRGRGIRRADLIRLLDSEGLLPAIMFIFSRAGCDAAVQQCARSRLRLTDDDEQRRIRRILDERLASIGIEDEQVLCIGDFRRAALDGYAAHHAGMILLLKTVVEELFANGLLKAVFATETLALGINMPARSVVLEKLVKFNGIDHADLTPGEYTQLTGRAGRRGIDTEGHAVVVAGPRFDAQAVASLASRRTYPLRSAFRPTPNMAVNLLEVCDTARARTILETSFAQFQADRSVVGLARRARELEGTVADYTSALRCDHGDLLEYADLQAQITAREKELSRERASQDRERTRGTLRRLQRGQILALPGGRRRGYVVVLHVDRDVIGGPAIEVLDTDARRRTLRSGDLPSAPAVIDTLRLPRPDRLSSAKVRRDTAAALRSRLAGHDEDPRRAVRERAPRTPSTAATDMQLLRLKEKLAAHPCAACPELDAHMRWVGRRRSTLAELASVTRRIDGRTSTLARQFDHLCALLLELGYLHENEDGELKPTAAGRRLRHVFSDRDLLIAECLEHGAWQSLTPAGLAAVVSAAVHESRRDDTGAADLPAEPAVEIALNATTRLSEDLHRAQLRHGVDPTSPPDPAVCSAVHQWASGTHLAAALTDTTLSAGDFVRHCRQVIDLLDQLTADPELGATARQAVAGVRRGLVAQEITA